MEHETEYTPEIRPREDTEDPHPVQTLLQVLLSNGICDLPKDCDIRSLSRLLTPLSYEPVILPHKKLIILKDLHITQGVSVPWKEQFIDRAKDIFVELAHGVAVKDEGPAASLLVDNRWLTRNPDCTLRFTERSLVQFADFILSLGGKYTKCNLCGFLCQGEYHAECKSIISRLP